MRIAMVLATVSLVAAGCSGSAAPRTAHRATPPRVSAPVPSSRALAAQIAATLRAEVAASSELHCRVQPGRTSARVIISSPGGDRDHGVRVCVGHTSRMGRVTVEFLSRHGLASLVSMPDGSRVRYAHSAALSRTVVAADLTDARREHYGAVVPAGGRLVVSLPVNRDVTVSRSSVRSLGEAMITDVGAGRVGRDRLLPFLGCLATQTETVLRRTSHWATVCLSRRVGGAVGAALSSAAMQPQVLTWFVSKRQRAAAANSFVQAAVVSRAQRQLPILGLDVAWPYRGFEQIEPRYVTWGGDGTSFIRDVHWATWGGEQAVGQGVAEYVGPNGSPASGHAEAATVVASDLGRCQGHFVYRELEWYFPQHHEQLRQKYQWHTCRQYG
jgi:hypothetical protein